MSPPINSLKCFTLGLSAVYWLYFPAFCNRVRYASAWAKKVDPAVGLILFFTALTLTLVLLVSSSNALSFASASFLMMKLFKRAWLGWDFLTRCAASSQSFSLIA